MYTIQVSSCISVQGDLVETLPNGDAIIRDGRQFYRGRTISSAPQASQNRIRPETRPQQV